jgi:hypothetical protein
MHRPQRGTAGRGPDGHSAFVCQFKPLAKTRIRHPRRLRKRLGFRVSGYWLSPRNSQLMQGVFPGNWRNVCRFLSASIEFSRRHSQRTNRKRDDGDLPVPSATTDPCRWIRGRGCGSAGDRRLRRTNGSHVGAIGPVPRRRRARPLYRHLHSAFGAQFRGGLPADSEQPRSGVSRRYPVHRPQHRSMHRPVRKCSACGRSAFDRQFQPVAAGGGPSDTRVA